MQIHHQNGEERKLVQINFIQFKPLMDWFADCRPNQKVHRKAGSNLYHHLKNMPVIDQETGFKCKIGHAILTPSFALQTVFPAGLIHVVPPFVDQGEKRELLQDCYKNAVQEASKSLQDNDVIRIASGLVGAGCRGFPIDFALECALEGAQKAVIIPNQRIELNICQGD